MGSAIAGAAVRAVRYLHDTPWSINQNVLAENTFPSHLGKVVAGVSKVGPDQLERLKQALGGHYQFERELGQGAFATVFLARDVRLERLVAVKVLHIEPSSELNEIRFLREIRFLAGLQHPNIVPVHDSGHLENLLYYVMPYVRGESLRERIKRERQLAVADAVRITCELADALDCAHNTGIIHRDIKPENILLSGSHPMLADFGVARAINISRSNNLTRPGFGSPGTPAYMSPEQMLGERELDRRTDIYSLGCVLYEMLTGKAPFEGEGGFVKRFTEHAPSVRTVRHDVNSALDRTLAKALERIPEQRYGSASEMAKSLSESESQRPNGARSVDSAPATGWDQTRNRRRARYALATGGGTILLLAAVVAATVVTRGKKAEAAASGEQSRHIAVMYFEDLTPDKRLATVATGLTEDLIDQLSQVSGLRVISPNGVRAFRDNSLPIDSIARRLNTGTLIGGSVSSSGATLRLTVRLIDGTTGDQFHTRTFQRPSWDFFTLQDSLTSDVAFALRERLGREIRLREQRSVASSIAAWQLVQRGEGLTSEGASLIRRRDSTAAIVLERADSLFAQAEALDPKWITPTVDRARNALTSAFVEPSNVRLVESALKRAGAQSERALTKSGDAPEALAARGEARLRQVTFGIAARTDSLLRLAQADLQKAAGARPDLARTWNLLGEVYLAQGRYSEAAGAYKSAFDADAFLTEARGISQMLIFSNLSAGKFDDARRWCREAQRRFTDDLRFFECELVILGWSGNTRKDIAAAWEKVIAIEKRDSTNLLAINRRFRRMMVAAVLARAGLRDSARSVLAQAPREADLMRPALTAEAYVHVLLGQRKEAIAILTQLVSASPHLRAVVAQSPWFTELRTEPEFRTLFAGSF